MQFYGQVQIEGASGVMTVRLKDVGGQELYKVEIKSGTGGCDASRVVVEAEVLVVGAVLGPFFAHGDVQEEVHLAVEEVLDLGL